MKKNLNYIAFNRGLVSALGIARLDIKRLALAASTMKNWMTRVLGSMMLRPGWGYIGATASNNTTRQIPFIFSTTDVAVVELTASLMRIWISDALLTRPSVATTITNGTFTGSITGWTDGSDAGGTAAYAATNLLRLTGNGTARGLAYQQITVAAPAQGVEHALRIVVSNGPVVLRVGSALGADGYVSETSLDTGTHSISLTPTGNFFVQFSNVNARRVDISNCTIEAAGTVTLPAPWTASDLANIRTEGCQSGDVIFVACDTFQQRRIERRGTRPNARSWSIALYRSNDGPFFVQNISATTLTPSSLTGNINLTASVPMFKSTHVGALFKLISSGQNVTLAIAAENTFTSAIRVTNVGEQRRFTITITGTWVATVTLQRSLDNQLTWNDVANYTTNQAITYADGLDNQIIHYRIGIKTGGWTSGTATCTLAYSLGSLTGIARVTTFTSSTVVAAEVLSAMGATTSTTSWSEGAWSDLRGWPTAGVFYEGRLWWAGRNGIFGSASDAFDSFSESLTGDAAPINRTIGSGPVDTINFALALQRLILGAQGTEFSCRSSSLDEPLTPTNFNVKPASGQGSAAVEAIKVDANGIFVQRGGTRVFELSFDHQNYTFDYNATHLSVLVPEIGLPSITRMAVQRQPDTRIHCVRSDGTVAILVFDKLENVICWLTADTNGTVEDVCVLPAANATQDDSVYYVVRRTINGATVRYREKWALESDCVGGTLNKQADAFVTYTGAATATITGLSHLEAASVVVWGDGVYLGTATVSGGQITVPGGGTVTNAVVGLTYTAQWKSSKLAMADIAGGSLTMRKIIKGLGLILMNTHATGLRYGPDFNSLQDLPGIERGKAVGANEIRSSYDEETFEFSGTWDTDSRLCLQATAPKPCAILAAICEGESA